MLVAERYQVSCSPSEHKFLLRISQCQKHILLELTSSPYYQDFTSVKYPACPASADFFSGYLSVEKRIKKPLLELASEVQLRECQVSTLAQQAQDIFSGVVSKIRSCLN
jgi:hypothetical protein